MTYKAKRKQKEENKGSTSGDQSFKGQELSDEYVVPKVAFDIVENEPVPVWVTAPRRGNCAAARSAVAARGMEPRVAD